jgi:hypothetical protein
MYKKTIFLIYIIIFQDDYLVEITKEVLLSNFLKTIKNFLYINFIL